MPRIIIQQYDLFNLSHLALAVHGGAGDINSHTHKDHIAGVRRAVHGGRAVLESGGTALDACLAAVVVLENDTAFNAGIGSLPNRAGKVESDAGAMYEPNDGMGPYFGAVSALPLVKNPCLVAARLLGEKQAHFLTGEAALSYAISKGYELYTEWELLAGYAWKKHFYRSFLTTTIKPRNMPISDTVGAAACDRQGNLAAVTSSGGVPFKWEGRVGDSPLPGAGLWADHYAAASSTGFGEYIMRAMICIKAAELIKQGKTLTEAVKLVMDDYGAIGGLGGLILINREGGMAAAYNTPFMSRGFWREGEAIQVAI